MHYILSIILIGGIGVQALISCASNIVEELSSSSSSSIDCSIISSSSISEDLCLDFDPDAEIEHYGKMKKQFCDERDGKKYVYVQIGEQIWMAENLNYDVCGSICTWYCGEHGRLYDWSTALAVCPDGWHLPSDEEWTALTDYAGGEYVAGTKLKASGGGWSCEQGSQECAVLKRDYLASDGYSCQGVKKNTDDYGFSALPAGSHDGYSFSFPREDGVWWSSTEFRTNAYYRSVSSYGYAVTKFYKSRKSLLSVRCVRDAFQGDP